MGFTKYASYWRKIGLEPHKLDKLPLLFLILFSFATNQPHKSGRKRDYTCSVTNPFYNGLNSKAWYWLTVLSFVIVDYTYRENRFVIIALTWYFQKLKLKYRKLRDQNFPYRILIEDSSSDFRSKSDLPLFAGVGSRNKIRR